MLRKIIDRIDSLPIVTSTLAYMGIVLHFAGLVSLILVLLVGLPGCDSTVPKPPLKDCLREFLPS